MFDYTKTIFNKTMKDFDLALTLYRFGTQIIYIAYLIYILFVPNNIWYLHLALLIISTAFFVFDIVTTKEIKALKREKISFFGKRKHNEKLARAKKRRSDVTRVKFYASHVIKLFVLASTFYPIIVAPNTVHPLSIMGTTVMVLLWIMQVILEVLRIVLEGRGEMFMEAFNADIEFVTKPVNSVKNTFKKIIGHDVEEEEAPTKQRIYLDKLVESARAEKNNEKAAAKAEKSEKISSWLDNQISKIPFMRKETSSTELEARNVIEVEPYDDEI